MNEFKPILRLMVTVQIFLLFLVIILPAVIRHLQEPEGKWVYAFLAVLCILQALLLRRALTRLE
jgi:hypothetical protein